ncbi:hypothetical protein AB0I81_17685 [Nonomuraea sp. NPDC050404]|uniref:hypothetical protein n=1 Tax=Nonomuraea sp. NPDC050404 TaxID=3155783 RepID=UPI0033E13344
MYLTIVEWDLTRSSIMMRELRDYLRDYAVEAYSGLEGMRLKTWYSSLNGRFWGAVYLWDSAEDMSGSERISRAIELIGYAPTSVSVFQVEAITEGRSRHGALAGIGLAMETT